MTFPLPANLAEHAHEPGRRAWTAALPGVVETLSARWSLRVGPPFEPGGRTAWVAPADSERFGEVVLKVAWRHDEAFDEAEGLREWDGAGTVRLLDATEPDGSTTALLLERCRPGQPLSGQPDEVQDHVIAAVLHHLWENPHTGGAFRPLEQMCAQWAAACEHRLGHQLGGGAAGLARDGIALFRSLPASADRHVLLCTDLHAGNVLAARREPWLVIDPKPYVGDPTYDVVQHLLNCAERLVVDPLALVWRMADLVGLDPDRLALWLFARCIIEVPDRPELLAVADRLARARR